MSTKDNDPAQDPKQASLLSGDAAMQAADAAADAPAGSAAKDNASNETTESTESTTGAQGAAGAEHGAASAAASDAAAAVPTAAEGNAAQAAQAEAQAAAADAGAADAASGDAETSDAATASEPEVPGQLPGELLAARRMEMRLSIEELSARVKLAPRQLIALEANDFGSLPGMATTRGFIRSCAKSMGMDPEPLLAMLANEPNPALGPMVMRRPLPQPGFNGRRYAPSTSHRRSANKLSGVAAVILIFVGMLSYVAWRNDWLHLPSLDFSSSQDAASSSSTIAAPDAQPQATEAAADAEPTAPTAVAPAGPAPTTAAKAAATSPASPADNEVYAPAAPAPVAPTPKAEPSKAAPAANAAKVANIDPARALELNLREDSWVEVLTQNGERKLLSRLVKAGSTERIEVTEPLTLVVGNAAGVDVTLRGQPVSLKSGTRDNVAKVNLK